MNTPCSCCPRHIKRKTDRSGKGGARRAEGLSIPANAGGQKLWSLQEVVRDNKSNKNLLTMAANLLAMASNGKSSGYVIPVMCGFLHVTGGCHEATGPLGPGHAASQQFMLVVE